MESGYGSISASVPIGLRLSREEGAVMAATALPIESAAPEEAVQVMEHLAENLSLSTVLYSVLLFLACLLVMKVVMTLTDRAMTRLKVEPTVHKFTRSCLKVLMWLVTVMVVAAYLGLPINSLVAILGIVGVALSLSLQGRERRNRKSR